MSYEPLRDDVSHEGIRIMPALAAFKLKGEGEPPRGAAAQPHQSAITALVLGSMMMSRRSPRNSAVIASPRRNA
jgi:hypothetical protein